MAQHAILRFEKHKGNPARPLEAHHERQKEQYASNPDIDTAKSKYNFHIVKPEGRYEHVNYDGENSSCYLIVSKDSASDGGSSFQNIAYLTTSEEGISGIEHEGIGKNLAKADFRVYIDVSDYSDNVYTLGVVLMCNHEGSEIRISQRFPDTLNFAVRSGEVISPIKVDLAEQATAGESSPQATTAAS